MTVYLKNDLEIHSDDSTVPTSAHKPTMTVPNSSNQFPFMNDSTRGDEKPDSAAPSSQAQFDSYLPQPHQHHESTSTSASDSADSSPTTTVSIADDSSVTEMSPGSSPESPMAKITIPLRPAGQNRPHTSDEHTTSPPSGGFFDLQRPQTPGKRPRNLKNLAVNTTGAPGMNRAASTTSLPAEQNVGSLPALSQVDLCFTRPLSPPKRRPSALGLTIMTPANNKTLQSPPQLAIPATPALSRPNLLRHFQSSPSLPVFPPTRVSQSGLPSIALRNQSSQPTSLAKLQGADSDEPNYDIPQSREEKPEAYPDGPICVYEPHVDLYLEPTAKQALQYDVVLNVASEVRNPFFEGAAPLSTTTDIVLDGGGGIKFPRKQTSQLLSREDAALSPVQESSSPSTPRATPSQDVFALQITATGKDPEYIHIPWEHNTDIVPDLLRLVKLIDDRVQTGKRVLVHCQCGVSRSATLVVAYCLYKNPQMTVQEAYDTIKQRSKWIGPNMNLIMQLQEFRSSLITGTSRRIIGRSLTPVEASGSWNDWQRPRQKANGFLEPVTPKTAPLPPASADAETSRDLHRGSITPGPSSAPSGFAWVLGSQADAEARSVEDHQEVNQESTKRSSILAVPTIQADPIQTAAGNEHEPSANVRPHALKLDNLPSSLEPSMAVALPSPRAAEFAMAPLQPPSEVAPEDHFGLMSPSASEFQHSPLDRAALLGSLGMGAAFLQNESPQELQRPVAVSRYTTGVTSASDVEQDAIPPLAGADPPMSPRAFEFTQNPFALAQTMPEATLATKKAESTADLTTKDPRSPPQKGASPIIRNIADFL